MKTKRKDLMPRNATEHATFKYLLWHSANNRRFDCTAPDGDFNRFLEMRQRYQRLFNKTRRYWFRITEGDKN